MSDTWEVFPNNTVFFLPRPQLPSYLQTYLTPIYHPTHMYTHLPYPMQMYLKVLSDDFLLYPSVPDEEMCTLDNGVIGGDVFEGPPSSIHAPPLSSCCCCNTALLVNAALLPLSFQFNHHQNHQHHHPNHSHDHHQLHCSHHNHASLLSIIIIIISEFCCAAVVALLRPI